MTTFLLSILVSCLFILNPSDACSCRDQVPASIEVNQSITDDHDFPAWVQRGAYCYGIAVFTLPDGSTVGRSLRARIVVVAGEQIRLRAMETITLSQIEGCAAMAVDFGDTWWENNPNEVFQSREEADAFLKDKGWLID